VPAIAAAIQQQIESYPDPSENLLKEQSDQVRTFSSLTQNDFYLFELQRIELTLKLKICSESF